MASRVAGLGEVIGPCEVSLERMSAPGADESASSSPGPRRSLLLVEDDPFTRGLVADALRNAGFAVAIAANAVQAVEVFDRIDPDALIVDVNLGPGADGLELANALRSRAPYLAVLVLTRFPSPAVAGMAHRTPPHAAFLSKDAAEDPAMIVEALESALADDVPPVTGVSPDSPLAALTPAQFAVLRMVAEGWTNAEIAAKRGSTLRAIEKLTHRAVAALGIPEDARRNARVDAVRMYVAAFGVPNPRED